MNADYLVGKVIEGRYEILEIVGSGGMATVYKAKDRVLNRNVAIKALKESLKYDTDVVKRFNGESRAAARLSHPNIVQVYDVGEGGELDYIVMELVEGITLKEYITKKGRLPWDVACDFAAQIGRALDCAHTNHIIHRDIKPHNVLITRDGTLKVADFGIAQAATSETMVAGSAGIGSVHYISPEQARGGFTDERSDIYSLGVVLYEMLTGKLPFDGANPVSVALKKLEQEPEDCRIVNTDIPNDVAEITMKAISKEKHLRYQSTAAMVSDLENAMSRDTAGYVSEERFETKRLTNTGGREDMPKTRTRRKNKKSKNAQLIVTALIAVFVIGFATFFMMSGGTKEYMVPELIGLTIEEAEEKLSEDTEADLSLDEDVVLEPSEEVEEGKIISQKPGANQYVKKGRKIKVVVSSGSEDVEIEVPDVENLIYDEAVKKLEKEGLKVKKVEEFSETVQFDYVIKQSPKGSTKVSEGYTVTLYVSADIENPNEQAVVPKITGVTEDKARALIAEAGLKVGSVEHQASDTEAGKVIQQTPSAKTGVEKDTTVSFVVSSGPEPTPVVTKEPEMKKKTLTITIPDDSPDTVHIRAVANGKTIYDKSHSKSEKTVDIPVQSSKDAQVQVYIDGQLVADKTVTFD